MLLKVISIRLDYLSLFCFKLFADLHHFQSSIRNSSVICEIVIYCAVKMSVIVCLVRVSYFVWHSVRR